MNKKIIVYILLTLILLSGVVVAEERTFGEWLRSGDVFFTNRWYKDKGYEQSALTGWYPVDKWEVETCTRDVSASYEKNPTSNTGVFSSDALIIDTAITIQAYQQDFPEQTNFHEYEVAWYIHPFLEEINYEIQIYTEAEGWKSMEPPIKKIASPSYGDSGYVTWTGGDNISYLRILSDDKDNSELTVKMVKR